MPTKDQLKFSGQVGSKEKLKRKAKDRAPHNIWFGLSLFGLVGWAVVIPTILGTMLGIWLDKKYPADHSWTLSFLVIGLVLGLLNAWYWVSREGKDILDDPAEPAEKEKKHE